MQREEVYLKIEGRFEQISFQGGFESVQRRGVTDFCGERVPEGGGRNTEGSAPKGTEASVSDGMVSLFFVDTEFLFLILPTKLRLFCSWNHSAATHIFNRHRHGRCVTELNKQADLESIIYAFTYPHLHCLFL